MCFYFDDIIETEDDIDDDIFIDEKLDENILVYSMLYKYINWLKPFRIRFDEIDEFIRVYDGTRYLALFGSEKKLFIWFIWNT